MTDWLLPALAGFGTGILSAWGVGRAGRCCSCS